MDVRQGLCPLHGKPDRTEPGDHARHCVDHGLQVNPVLCNSTFLDTFAIQNMRLTTHPDPHNASANPLWYTVNKLVTQAEVEPSSMQMMRDWLARKR